MDKFLLTFGFVLYGIVVPWLEINDTHVFNPEWVAHARLHEVWQLLTNSLLGVFAMWRLWGSNNDRYLPSVIALLITGGFLVAYMIQGSYGGSMVHPDGSEKTLFGINVGVIGFGFVFCTSIYTMSKAHKQQGAM